MLRVILSELTNEFTKRVTTLNQAFDGDFVDPGFGTADALGPVDAGETAFVPNLAGTEALAGVMRLLPEITVQTDGPGLVQFIAGDHASFLSPATSPEATIEMQSQFATFAATSGTLIPFTNTAVINTVQP